MRLLAIHLYQIAQHEHNVTSSLGDRKSGGSFHSLKSLLRCEAHGVGFLMERDNSAIRKYNRHCRVRVFNRCNNISVADEVLNQGCVCKTYASQAMRKEHDRKMFGRLCDRRIFDRMRNEVS